MYVCNMCVPMHVCMYIWVHMYVGMGCTCSCIFLILIVSWPVYSQQLLFLHPELWCLRLVTMHARLLCECQGAKLRSSNLHRKCLSLEPFP